MGRRNKFQKDMVFGKDLSDHKSKEFDQMEFNTFYSDDTLNIFSDASGFSDRKSSYGIIAVCKDTIIHTATFCLNNATSQRGEAMGMRLALYFALANVGKFRNINIISDSLNTIEIIRYYSNFMAIKGPEDNYILGKIDNKSVVANGDILSECIRVYQELLLKFDYSIIKLFHINSHIVDDKQTIDYNKIDKARANLTDINILSAVCTRESFIYLAKFNNIIDYLVKMSLKEMLHRERQYQIFARTPVKFLPPKTPKEYIDRLEKEKKSVCFVDT